MIILGWFEVWIVFWMSPIVLFLVPLDFSCCFYINFVDRKIIFQIGLDGIRMLDPATSRTLRIYPLETVTRCEVSLF